MTKEQFSKAQKINSESDIVWKMIYDITQTSQFNDHWADDKRGLKSVLKPQYQNIVDLFKQRVNELEKEMESL